MLLLSPHSSHPPHTLVIFIFIIFSDVRWLSSCLLQPRTSPACLERTTPYSSTHQKHLSTATNRSKGKTIIIIIIILMVDGDQVLRGHRCRLSVIPHLRPWRQQLPAQVQLPLPQRHALQPAVLHLWLVVQRGLLTGANISLYLQQFFSHALLAWQIVIQLNILSERVTMTARVTTTWEVGWEEHWAQTKEYEADRGGPLKLIFISYLHF